MAYARLHGEEPTTDSTTKDTKSTKVKKIRTFRVFRITIPETFHGLRKFSAGCPVRDRIGRATTGGCYKGDSFLRPLRCYILKFARPAQIFLESKTLGFGYYSRQDAKTLSSEENNNSPQSNSLPLFRPLRLGVFAGDIPRVTGARSAPCENLRVLRAFVVNPAFLILVAALPR